jgi:ParB family chromosome partitioning protein
MRLSTSFVAVRKIFSSTSAADFDGDKIEQLARQIVKSEGIIRPLVLNRTSLESYEVVEGHFEYHAAFRAREIDLRRAEMIAAYILDPENDDVSDAITEQIELLKTVKPIDLEDIDQKQISVSNPSNSQEDQMVNDIKVFVDKKVASIEKILSGLSSQIQAIQNIVGQIQREHDQSISSTQLKQLFEQQLTDLKQIIQPVIVKPPIIETESILQDFNSFSVEELENKISKSGVRAKAKSFAQGIYDGRQSKLYNSVSDVKVAGLGPETMKKIIDRW